MSNALGHRGFDDAGAWLDEKMSLLWVSAVYPFWRFLRPLAAFLWDILMFESWLDVNKGRVS